MHLVTSSIFLPSICALISPLSRARLLKAYLAAICIWAVARGQPSLDVKGFVEDMQRSNAEICSGSGTEPFWAKWIELAKVHPEAHLAKTIRSLAGWARVFESRRARLPLGKMVKSVKSGLVADAGVANDQLKKDGSGESEIALQDADPSPRAHRDWKIGTLIAPKTMGVHSSSEVRMSNSLDLSPRQEGVNGGYAGQVSFKPSPELESAAVSGNEVMPSTELPGSEYLDGSLFFSVATLTFKRMNSKLEVVERTSNLKEVQLDRRFCDFGVVSR